MGKATSTVKTASGDTAVVADDALNTAADPKTANGDAARKEQGISASATAEQVLANGGVDTTDHSLVATPADDIPADPDPAAVLAGATGAPVDGRVLAAVTIAGTRYQPNDVVVGLPGSIAEQHRDSIDTHPDAVAYARAQGFPVKLFSEAA